MIALPVRPDVPRFDVGGPTIAAGDVAIVSSSQLGFAAVDWRRGALVWTRPAGLHVAPPVVGPLGVILISDCTAPVEVADTLLGCIRVVSASGIDQGYAAIHGERVAAFAASPGTQDVWLVGDRTVRWRRGDQAVAVDLITGVATPAPTAAPPIRVAYRTHTWDISRTEQAIVARERGKVAWQTRRPYTALLGAVYLADLAPMVRVASIGVFGGWAEMNLLDIDATGSLHGQAAFPVPGDQCARPRDRCGRQHGDRRAHGRLAAPRLHRRLRGERAAHVCLPAARDPARGAGRRRGRIGRRPGVP